MQGAEAGGGDGNPSRRLGHLVLGASHRGQGSSLAMRWKPTTPWMVVLAMVGMAAAVDLDLNQIRCRFFTWMVGGAMRAPVRG